MAVLWAVLSALPIAERTLLGTTSTLVLPALALSLALAGCMVGPDFSSADAPVAEQGLERHVQLGQQVGALRVITSGLTPDDLVVIGELWRSSPGTKATPQLKTID